MNVWTYMSVVCCLGISQPLPSTIHTHSCPRKHFSSSSPQILNATTIFYFLKKSPYCHRRYNNNLSPIFVALATMGNDTISLTILPAEIWQHENSTCGSFTIGSIAHCKQEPSGLKQVQFYPNDIKHQQ